jgi:hypothetical protein
VEPSVEFVGPCGAGRVGIVSDGLVSHEKSDDVGQLTWVREVDCVSRSVDHDKDAMVFLLARNFLYARRTRHQRVPTSGNDQHWLV